MVSASEAVGVIEVLAWDRVRLHTVTAGDGEFTVVAGGAAHGIGLWVVDAIDGIGPEDNALPLVRDQVRGFCAHGLTGDEKLPVIGIDPTYHVSGPLETRPASEGCVGLLLVSDDLTGASVRADFAGFSRTWRVVGPS